MVSMHPLIEVLQDRVRCHACHREWAWKPPVNQDNLDYLNGHAADHVHTQRKRPEEFPWWTRRSAGR